MDVRGSACAAWRLTRSAKALRKLVLVLMSQGYIERFKPSLFFGENLMKTLQSSGR